MSRPLNKDDISEITESINSAINHGCDLLVQDIFRLRKQVSETEDRLSARLLENLKELCSDDEQFTKIKEKFEQNSSFDALEIERERAWQASCKSRDMSDIKESAQNFMEAYYRHISESSNIQPNLSIIDEVQDNMVRCREHLFSLLKEYSIKRQFEKMT